MSEGIVVKKYSSVDVIIEEGSGDMLPPILEKFPVISKQLGHERCYSGLQCDFIYQSNNRNPLLPPSAKTFIHRDNEWTYTEGAGGSTFGESGDFEQQPVALLYLPNETLNDSDMLQAALEKLRDSKPWQENGKSYAAIGLRTNDH